MYSLENEYLSIKVAAKGAELQSLYHKKYELEYMWSGDPVYWGKHSPVLFPIVGELKNKTYTYNNQTYKLDRHGFAREMEFAVSQQDVNSISFTLKSNSETLANYPFPFLFSVTYTLDQDLLIVAFTIENTGVDKMFFSVGAHPAFKVPLVAGSRFEDYNLTFSQPETVARWPISSDGLITSGAASLLKDEDTLPLKKELFAADAIVLKDLKSSAVTITSLKTKRGIQVSFPGFPYLGIWQTKGGDFVCIEPWCGIADSVDATGQLEDKEGINMLDPSNNFKASYSIKVF